MGHGSRTCACACRRAVESQKRAANAWDNGYFDKSVTPIRDHIGLTLLDKDEHMRPGTSMEDLAGLNPAFAMMGEQAGFDAAYVTDHPAPTDAWLASGGHQTLDPFVALSFVAAATERLLLQLHVLIVAYRNPFLSAKAIASLDALSGGRVIAGIAAGYLEGEFEALGVPPAFKASANRASSDRSRSLRRMMSCSDMSLSALIRRKKSSFEISSTVTSLAALAVALRGRFSTNAISPRMTFQS